MADVNFVFDADPPAFSVVDTDPVSVGWFWDYYAQHQNTTVFEVKVLVFRIYALKLRRFRKLFELFFGPRPW